MEEFVRSFVRYLVWCGALAISLLPAFGQSAASRVPLINQYCIGCHNQKLTTAGVSLVGLDLTKVGDDAAMWERVLRKVSSGQMPPAGLPHPDASVSAAFSKSLEAALDRAAVTNPNPGRTAPHRLNRAEYSNAIRDLLALDIQPGAALPGDDSGYGFDNIGDVLSVSPALLERYLSVARRVSRLAVGDLTMKPEKEAPAIAGGSGNERASDDLPFNSRGGGAFKYYFPLDAEYVLQVKLAGDGDGGDLQGGHEVRVPIKAGLHTVGVTFLRESAKAEVAAPAGGRNAGGPPAASGGKTLPAQLDVRLDGVKLKRFEVASGGGRLPQVGKVFIGGPYNPTGRGETPSRAKIFVCRPAGAADEAPCARTILSTLAHRAFRRPVTDTDIRPLLAFYQNARREGDFDYGIEKALRALLVSPSFLFRVERDPAGAAPGTSYRVSDLELASRLSFFLWSSIPDDQLLALAEQGKLRDPAVLQQQVRRMLDDRRADALVDNFAGQWLQLRNLATVRPDPDVFPGFDDSLRRSMERETELFFASIVREDRSILDLLGADYTYLNQRLAEHYGIRKIYGSQFRRVALTDSDRGGLLGQGSILTVTSYPNRTSVVQRGKWILENLLGTPPPPPPPDVPELQPHAKDGRVLTLRQQMEQHRSNPACASCHARMDPIGFALENYDGVGKWRTEEAGAPIDVSGKLPDGAQFAGPAGLKKLLLTGHKDEFVSTVTERLLTYALGRGLEHYDIPTVRSISRQAAGENYRMSALVTAIVKSTPFQMRSSSTP